MDVVWGKGEGVVKCTPVYFGIFAYEICVFNSTYHPFPIAGEEKERGRSREGGLELKTWDGGIYKALV